MAVQGMQTCHGAEERYGNGKLKPWLPGVALVTVFYGAYKKGVFCPQVTAVAWAQPVRTHLGG